LWRRPQLAKHQDVVEGGPHGIGPLNANPPVGGSEIGCGRRVKESLGGELGPQNLQGTGKGGFSVAQPCIAQGYMATGAERIVTPCRAERVVKMLVLVAGDTRSHGLVIRVDGIDRPMVLGKVLAVGPAGKW